MILESPARSKVASQLRRVRFQGAEGVLQVTEKDPAMMINESPGSVAAREAASRLGEVVGSSYSTYERRPVAWAFHIKTAHFGAGLTLLRAGSERSTRGVLLLVEERNAFGGMVAAKALAVSKLGHHRVLTPNPGAFGGNMPSLTFTFYLCTAKIGLPVEYGDLCAVGVHAGEDGLSASATLQRLRIRTPLGITTADPVAAEPFFLSWWKLVRAMRRVNRFRELGAPEIVVANDLEAVHAALVELRERGWTPERAPLPDDVAHGDPRIFE